MSDSTIHAPSLIDPAAEIRRIAFLLKMAKTSLDKLNEANHAELVPLEMQIQQAIDQGQAIIRDLEWAICMVNRVAPQIRPIPPVKKPQIAA